MQNLLDFIKAHYHWLVFLVLEVMSLIMLFQGYNYQSAVWTTTANTVAGRVYGMESGVMQYFDLLHINEELTVRNAYLEHEVQKLAEKLDEQRGDSTYRALVESSVLHGYSLIPAKVVENSVNQKNNLMTINKGTADGVQKDMGVISGQGVVGIVYLAGKHYSVVIPALSTKSNISCMIQNRGYFGYLHWDGGQCNIAYVDDVPRHAHFKLYERVVTSGYSAVFPRGVAVGKILHVFNSPDGISYRLQVQLYTDFAKLRDVCVIDNTEMIKHLDVLRAAQDSLKADEQQE